MDKTQMEKFTTIKGQMDDFGQKVIVYQTKLGTLRDEYMQLIDQLNKETNSANIQEALARVQSLEQELAGVNSQLMGIFADFEQRMNASDGSN